MDFSQPKHPNKKYIAIFYDKCETLFEDFTNEEAGQIIKAAIAYDIGGHVPEFEDRAMRVYFAGIKKDIDLTTDKANKRSETNRQNVKNRWKDKPAEEMTEEEIDNDIARLIAEGKL